MAEVHRLLQLAGLQIERVDPASPAARWCVGQYFDELDRRFESGFDPAASLSAEDRDLIPPRGAFLVASVDGEPVACGAVKSICTRRRVAQANVGCRHGTRAGHRAADAGGAGGPGARARTARHFGSRPTERSRRPFGCTEAPAFVKWPPSTPIPTPITGSRRPSALPTGVGLGSLVEPDRARHRTHAHQDQKPSVGLGGVRVPVWNPGSWPKSHLEPQPPLSYILACDGRAPSGAISQSKELRAPGNRRGPFFLEPHRSPA